MKVGSDFRLPLLGKTNREIIQTMTFHGVSRRVDEIYTFLEQKVIDPGTTYYQEIGERFDLPYEHNMLGPTLAEISRRSMIAHGFMLSVIVIKKGGAMEPGHGFFELARQFGYEFRDSPLGRDTVWLGHYKAARAYYKPLASQSHPAAP